MTCDVFSWLHKERRSAVGRARKVAALASRRDLIAPILLSVAAILLTSVVINEAHVHLTALHIWHDPEDLALAYILPTIFITILFGSNIGVSSALLSGLAAAYFVYPPQFSMAIDNPENLVETRLFASSVSNGQQVGRSLDGR